MTLQKTDVTPLNVFISYRREDTAGYAGRIYDRLNARFPNRVFMDVTRLDLGVDFVEEIQKAVGSCRVLIVLIGKHWAVSSDGTPRLQDPHDFVRLEVAHALERKIRVIPILVGGASIPSADTLPPEVGALLRRQVLKLDDSAFDYNVSQLIGALEQELGPSVKPRDAEAERTERTNVREAPPRQEEPRTVYMPYPPQKKSRKWLWIGVGGFGVFLVLGVIGSIIEEFSTPIDPQATAALLNSIQEAANSGATPSSANTPGSSFGQDSNPKAQTPVAPGTADDADSNPSRQSEYFDAPGRWRVSLGEGAAVSLVLDLESDGSFAATTEGAGFSFPASAGGWTYDRSLRVLTLTGVNNIGGFFQTIFQNLELDEDHYHAFVPGQGNVVLTKE
jgi:hypothetical protein